MSYKRITIEQAKSLIDDAQVTLVDVRDPQSFSDNHIDNSINVLNNTLEEFLANANIDLPLIVYCYHGNTSQGAADYFSGMGFKDVYSVDGGFEKWRLKYV